LSVFVDSSVWFAAMVVRDRNNVRAKSVLGQFDERVTSDHVVVETWLLLNSRGRRDGAEQFWERLRQGIARIEHVTAADFESA
jgi:predicted nucleic acid-binding protein